MPARYEFAWSLQTTTGIPLYLPSTSRRAVIPAGTLPAGQGSTVTLHARAVMADGSYATQASNPRRADKVPGRSPSYSRV